MEGTDGRQESLLILTREMSRELGGLFEHSVERRSHFDQHRVRRIELGHVPAEVVGCVTAETLMAGVSQSAIHVNVEVLGRLRAKQHIVIVVNDSCGWGCGGLMSLSSKKLIWDCDQEQEHQHRCQNSHDSYLAFKIVLDIILRYPMSICNNSSKGSR
ncbi:MAG: hypothetical protein Q7S19_01230 [bacterium]|nr:hypothetical protein [bacterium]